MKICWDNLEEIWLTPKGNFRRGNCTYTYKEECKYCGDPFLRANGSNNVFCSMSCASNSIKGHFIADITNQRFGRLVVKEFSHMKGKRSFWLCVCDCGNEKPIYLWDLKDGKTKSCGCLNREVATEKQKKIPLRYGEDNPGWKGGQKAATKRHYYKDHEKSKLYYSIKAAERRAMKLNQTPELTEMEKNIINFYYEVCGTMADYHVDHIKPISKGGLHHPDNLQILSAELNLQKHDKWPLSKEEQIKYKGYQCFYKEN